MYVPPGRVKMIAVAAEDQSIAFIDGEWLP
jgi:hypothetical protein